MNEAQSLRTVRNVLRLENLSADIAAPVQRELTRILQEVAAMVEAMDDDPLNATLFRQARWRTYEAQLRLMLQPVNDEFYDLLVRELAAEIPRQVQEAERYMLDAGIKPYQSAAEVLPPGVGTDGSVGVPAITRTQLYRVAADTEVLNRPLQTLFQSETARPPAPLPASQAKGGIFIESQKRQIDAVVKRGFLLGETNQEIAKNLIGEGAARSRREAATIARTAVMQMSADAHQGFWDANSSVIAGYEYDALLDYRTCAYCAPYDGRTAPKRSDLPATPQHPNCRCSVLPLTETEMELRKERGPQRRTVIELVEVTDAEASALAAERDPQKKRRLRDDMRARAEATAAAKENTTAARSYAQTVNVDGRTYWRVARDIKKADHPLTHGEFLLATNKETRETTLGKKRAAKFMELTAKHKNPDKALAEATQVLRSPEQMTPAARKRRRGVPPIGHSRAAVRVVAGELKANAPAVRKIPRQPR